MTSCYLFPLLFVQNALFQAQHLDWVRRTFHEQRSLSERLYRKQGIDTQALLGHTTRLQTDRYNNTRGKEWVTITC